MLLQIVACSSAKKETIQKPIDQNVTVSVPAPVVHHYYSTAESIAWGRYQKYREGGMNHQESLLMLRRYNGMSSGVSANDDLRIQAEQLMNYFCFENEEHKNFGSLKGCREWASQTQLRCEVFTYGNYSSKMIECLKRDLPKGLQ